MSPPADSARLLYSLDRGPAYHFVTAVLLVFGLVVTWLASMLTPEAVREDFGPLLPAWLVQAIFLLVAWSGLVAWLWWMRRYVHRLSWLPEEQRLLVERLGLFARCRRLPLSAISAFTAHAGRSDFPGAVSVHAPYRRLRLQGLPPLILDDQGTVHDHRALEAILAGRAPDSTGSPPRSG